MTAASALAFYEMGSLLLSSCLPAFILLGEGPAAANILTTLIFLLTCKMGSNISSP